MKKALISLAMLLMIKSIGFAQTTNSSAVPVNGSFVTITSVDVYPFNGANGPFISKIDRSLHFKLNKGTKFFIVKVLDTASSTVGYVITPWLYKYDTAEIRKRNLFYDCLRDKKIAYYKRIADAKIELVNAQARAKKDSLYLDAAKTDLAKSRLKLQKATNALVTTTPILKATAGKSRKPVSNDVKSFIGLQVRLRSELVKSKTLSDSTSVIHSILDTLKKAPTPQLDKVVRDVKSGKYSADIFLQNLITAQTDYEDSRSALSLQASVVKRIKLGGQQASSKNDIVWNKTKSQIYDRQDDAPADTGSLAAKYEDIAYVDFWANHWQFFITAKDFTDNCTAIFPHSNKFTWGFLTLPVKVRFDNDNPGGRFNFEQNLNFGLTFGDKMQWKNTNDISTNFLFGLSIVNVGLNDATAATATLPATSATSTPAVSISLGCMFQYDLFQIGIFAGRDFAGQHANQFAYQGKPWIGFAIGLSLFGASKTTASAQTQ